MTQAEFRQWAMIYAMQGLLANPNTRIGNLLERPQQMARDAITFADALLEANTIDEEPKSDD